MSEDYKDVLIDKIINDYETEKYSIYAIAVKYSFPSLKILSNVLKRYYLREYKITLDNIDYFSAEEKQKIFNEYKNKHYSLNQLSIKYMTTTTIIKNTVEEFETLEQIRAERKTNSVQESNIDINQIIDELNQGKTYSYIINKYGITYTKLKVKLIQNEQGREIVKKRKQKHKRNIFIPLSEIVDALKNGTLKQLENTYGVSETTLRSRLKNEYGDDYIYVLKNEKRGKKMPKQRVLSEENLLRYLKHNDNIEQLIEECKIQNIAIPQQLLDKYLQSKDEVNLHQIKTLVHEELSKLKDEGREPNYINPFKLANSLKQHGYGSNYQACAILYSLIEENNLPVEILRQIDNSQLNEAVLTLLNKDNINKTQFLQMLKNNKLAYIVYKEENDLNIDEKDNDKKENDESREI